jgi:hypothetical protein
MSKLQKSSIGDIRFMDTLHVMLVGHTIYWYTITNFGDYLVLAKITWYLPMLSLWLAIPSDSAFYYRSLEIQVGVAVCINISC